MDCTDRSGGRNITFSRRVAVGASALLALLFLLLSPIISDAAGPAVIRDLRIVPQAGALHVSARVVNCFNADMEAAILAGAPTSFTFLVDLYQEEPWSWNDKKVTGIVVHHTVKYDSLKKRFMITTASGQTLTVQNLEAAKKAMAELSILLPLPRYELHKTARHYVMVKAQLEKVRLPLALEHLFFFGSQWDFETNWFRQTVGF